MAQKVYFWPLIPYNPSNPLIVFINFSPHKFPERYCYFQFSHCSCPPDNTELDKIGDTCLYVSFASQRPNLDQNVAKNRKKSRFFHRTYKIDFFLKNTYCHQFHFIRYFIAKLGFVIALKNEKKT